MCPSVCFFFNQQIHFPDPVFRSRPSLQIQDSILTSKLQMQCSDRILKSSPQCQSQDSTLRCNPKFYSQILFSYVIQEIATVKQFNSHAIVLIKKLWLFELICMSVCLLQSANQIIRFNYQIESSDPNAILRFNRQIQFSDPHFKFIFRSHPTSNPQIQSQFQFSDPVNPASKYWRHM